jgi:hypothetical protein
MGMGKKFWSTCMIVFLGLTFVTVGALSVKATSCADAPDDILIDNDVYKRDIKGPVKLSHTAHVEEYGAKCTDCHHVFENGKNVWKEGDPVQKCGECHDPLEKKGNVDKLQNAYHNNCKDCHKEYAKENPDTNAPYRKCNDCHMKKS